LQEITVRGNHHISVEEIKQKSGLRIGENLLRISASRTQKALLSIAWVKEAYVKRVYPHTMQITIRERVPIAALYDTGEQGKPVAIAEGGRLLYQVAEDERPFLSVKGIEFTSSDPSSVLTNKEATKVVEYLYNLGMSEGPFSLMDFGNPRQVTLYTPDELRIILGSIEKIRPRIDALVALLASIDLDDYQSIDLRFEGEAILVPRKAVKR